MAKGQKNIEFFSFSQSSLGSVKKRGNTWRDRQNFGVRHRQKNISYLNAYSDIVFAASSYYKMWCFGLFERNEDEDVSK